MPNDDLGELLEPAPLLQALVRHGVDFVVIGGLAGLAHGSAYPTFDLDIAYARDAANLERLARALGEIGVTLRGAPPGLPFEADVRALTSRSNFTFDSRFGRFNVLGDVAGVSAYDDLRREARGEEIAGLDVRVASLDHLIAMKRAANRTKDKLMVEEYIELADLARREEEQGGSD
jgi:hypothetical protein